MEKVSPSRQSRYGGRAVRIVAALVAVCLAVITFPEAAMARTLKLVAFGDSLTAGYGLAPAEAFPNVLERSLKSRGHDVVVANAGVSGDTVAAGLARLDWSIPGGTDGVILELGANDALRGQDPAATKAGLVKILDRLKARNIPVLIAGMYAPRNLGAAYTGAFDAIYPDLAKQYGHPLYPFFLDGVVGEARLNLQDGIHPTAEGVRLIVDRITPSVEDFIRRIDSGS
ncbi:arylesterase [Terrihabitans sp. B22-R8]|uniref:arylesterase n=1 Tax=Terrihabitans sp. B22-R8 TaxID=3425128 RepID=UPI00403CD5F4